MLRFLAQRVAGAVVVLLLVSLFVFLLLELLPGDAAAQIAGENATQQQIEQTRQRLGLDDPVLVRYGEWLWSTLHGDLGESLYTSQDVWNAIAQRLPMTASLALVVLVLAVLMAIPLGTAAALRPNTVIDRIVSTVTSLAMAIPPFVLGLVLVILFAINRSWLPATGYVSLGEEGVGSWLRHLILPALAIAGVLAAELARQVRGSLLDTLSQDYIRAAWARGLRSWQVVGKHAMKNAASPVVTVFGLQVGRILGIVVTVEFVFAIPGFGSLAVSAVNDRDVPMIQGIVFVSALVVLIANLLADFASGYLNPRLRN